VTALLGAGSLAFFACGTRTSSPNGPPLAAGSGGGGSVAGGSPGNGDASFEPDAAGASDAAVNDAGGAHDADAGTCTPNRANGWMSNDAGYGCDDLGTEPNNPPGFCDNGVRMMPPTCNAVVDAILARTPVADQGHPCKTPTNGKAYGLDTTAGDPDKGKTAEMCRLNGAIYWVADQDIDCDGKMSSVCPGTPPNQDCCWQPQTSFGVDADGHVDPNGDKTNSFSSAVDQYVVIPQDNTSGIEPGTVVAVVYGDKVTFAVFADTGPTTLIGEGSVALANALGYPSSPANGGADGNTVTYIAFTGAGTVPANVRDRASIEALGNQLLTGFLANNSP
jgi:hypothetical protein